MRRLSRTGLLLLLLGAACTEDHPCDDSSVYQDRVCRPRPVDAAPAVGGPDGGMAADTAAGFGATCTDHPQCRAPADICIVPPGDTKGFCSAIDCNSRTALCPTGWSCCDLSKFQMGAPWGCLPLAACP